MQKQQVNSKDFSWPFWPIVPIYPYGQRRTLRTEVLKDTIWTFDQLQGIFYVVVPIRMTVIKLAGGGLLVYAPVAPTPECIRLVEEIVEQHGEVKYIILPTISGVEHKGFVPPFARHFATAQVFVAPKQWSFPLNLPLSWLGFPGDRTYVLPEDSQNTPFADEFDYAILDPIDLNLGHFTEVALFHKRSQTLLVTDSVVSVPEEPPEILQFDPYPLLFHARDSAFEPIIDTPTNRRKGWQRVSLFTLYFKSSVLNRKPVNWLQVFRDALKAPDRSKKAYFGLFPFKWEKEWKKSFDVLRGDGRPFVAPILQTLILNRAPGETINWANRVASWNFERIIPCHFQSPITANFSEFRRAFSFLEKFPFSHEGILPAPDLRSLQEIDKILCKTRISPPPKEKV